MACSATMLSPQTQLHLSERSSVLSPIQWAVEAVRHAWPEMSRSSIEALTLGTLDQFLVRLRNAMFGPVWNSQPKCRNCGEEFEVSLQPSQFGFGAEFPTIPSSLEEEILQTASGPIPIRPVIVHDMLVVERLPDEATAKSYFARAFGLAESDCDRALELSAALDPLSDIWIEAQCPECDAEQEMLFDPSRFFAEEISRECHALLGEVSDIAMVYHWSESEILMMPPARRRFYLERIGS